MLDVLARRALAMLVLGCVLAVVGCSGGAKVSINPPAASNQSSIPVTITTTSLPNGQIGQGYTATLAATGGKAPLFWSISSGALPEGLTLASTGAISGTPTASAVATPITFTVTDSGTKAQSRDVMLQLTVGPAPPPSLTVTTTSLPSGQVNHVYAATLTATGGIAPLSWAISSGELPAGLVFASTGAISGTPAATAADTPVTFTVSDSSIPAQKKDVTLNMSISPAAITVAITPARAAAAVTQPLTLTAITNDYAGVRWSVSPVGGSFNTPSTVSGAPVTLTSPSKPGVYTITATSVTDGSVGASITVGVTDLAGVFTYHNDLARDGANTQEYALTPTSVSPGSFGKLFSCTVDGAVYAQPLWVSNLGIGGTRRNVVLVATQHDSLYAFDADASPCLQLWHATLTDTGHGATSGETSVADSPTYWLVGAGYGDSAPEVGVNGTPVIDRANGILYVVSMSTNPAGTSFYQRLHALDINSGTEKTGSPVLIAGKYPGTGSGGTSVAFDPRQQRQRAGLTLVNGVVYIAWGSFEDHDPWYGWIMGYRYNGSTLVQSSVLNVAPNNRGAGIWMSGGAPAADITGNIYVTTGNGPADATASSGPTNDYGDSVLKLSSGLTVSDWFLPSAAATLSANDLDLGAGGAAVVVSPPTGPLQHLLITGGKDGTLYVLNADRLGGFGDSNAVQFFPIGGAGGPHSIFSTPAFWNNTLFIAPVSQPLLAFAFDTSVDKLNPAAPTSQSTTQFSFPGATASVSASGSSSNGIVWIIDSGSFCTHGAPGCGPAVLHAYDATNLTHELWNSAGNSADAAGNAVKFTVPTVVNGKVYVGTRGNNTGGPYGSTTISGELDVYGLKPN